MTRVVDPRYARVAIVIPTLNAGPYLPALLSGLTNQPIDPGQVLVIDSQSTDDTRAQFEKFGARVMMIDRAKFNHGGTRARAIATCADADIYVLMTQDAIPVDANVIPALIAAFDDPTVGVAYGRQLHRTGADGIESFSRLFNYGPEPQKRSLQDSATFGVKTTFCSNSFAAYRREAYEEVGGFPRDAFFAEDQITVGRMLILGWKIAYVPEAKVFHSHAYSIREDFNRYFDVGVFHVRNRWLRDHFGTAEGEGLRFIRSELAYLTRYDPLAIPSALIRTFAKYAGYRLGCVEHRLSNRIKTKLSMQPFYWKKLM